MEVGGTVNGRTETMWMRDPDPMADLCFPVTPEEAKAKVAAKTPPITAQRGDVSLPDDILALSTVGTSNAPTYYDDDQVH